MAATPWEARGPEHIDGYQLPGCKLRLLLSACLQIVGYFQRRLDPTMYWP